MAIKGEKIDFNKNYRAEANIVNKFELSGREDDYVVRAFFCDGTYADYTYDGFFYNNKEKSVRDLILDEGEDQPQETKKRKVVKISTYPSPDGMHDAIFALCDDGKIFSSWDNNEWKEYRPIPQN